MSGAYLFDEYLKYEVTIRSKYCKNMEKKLVSVEKKEKRNGIVCGIVCVCVCVQ